MPQKTYYLAKRKIPVLLLCPRCGIKEETAIHALFECTYAKKMWKLSPLGPVISTWKERSNFMNLLIGSCKLGHEFGRNEFAWFCGMAHMA